MTKRGLSTVGRLGSTRDKAANVKDAVDTFVDILETDDDGNIYVAVGDKDSLYVPADIVEALKDVSLPGDVFKVYMQYHSDYFIGGCGAMVPEWTLTWDKDGIGGEYRPYISVDVYQELLLFFDNERWGPYIERGGKVHDSPFGQIRRSNIRGSATFGLFRLEQIERDRRARGIIQ